jgi:hypothetical protein
MYRFISRIRTPIRRENSEIYLLLILFSFGISVAGTRLFLELTGYPQLGSGTLHFAHVLWGGLLLFIAALLPLIYANRWVYQLGAILAGVGVGLFIDEVGKFITQSNDYFYPAAAPIIYAFFLLTVLIYQQIKQPRPRSSRTELYRALEGLEDVLDHDLDIEEKKELIARLQYVVENAEHENFKRLAGNLLKFLEDEEMYVAPVLPGLLEKLAIRWRKIEARWFTQRRLKAIMIGGLIALAVVDLVVLGRFVRTAFSPEVPADWVVDLVTSGLLVTDSSFMFLLTRVILAGAVGVLLTLGAFLFLIGRDERATWVAYGGLLVALMINNLLVFYFDQFSTILNATVQLLFFLLLLSYRRRFIGQEN